MSDRKRNLQFIGQAATAIVTQNVGLYLSGAQTVSGLASLSLDIAEKLEAEMAKRFTPAEPKAPVEPPAAPVVRQRPKPEPKVTPPSDAPEKVFLGTAVDDLDVTGGTLKALKAVGLETVGHILDWERIKAEEGGLESVSGIKADRRQEVLDAIAAKREELGVPAVTPDAE